MEVLVVCRANVCRSRAAAALLAGPFRGIGARVSSAGVEAATTSTPCPEAVAFVAPRLPPGPIEALEGRGRPLTAALLEAADLVLTASREISTAVALARPAARPRTFTLRRAALSAAWVAAYVSSGLVPPQAPPLPAAGDVPGRWSWWVEELDAARGMAPMPAWATATDDQIDVLDPHEGAVDHATALAQIEQATGALTAAMAVVMTAP